jgi:hypothetical protein
MTTPDSDGSRSEQPNDEQGSAATSSEPDDYRFDPGHPAVIAELLDRCANGSYDTVAAWTAAWSDAAYATLEPPLRLEVDLLFTMELEEDFSRAGVVQLVESSMKSTSARALSDTPEAAWLLRAGLLSELTSNIMRAHLADVLLTGRRDTRTAHAELTVDCYVARARDSSEDVHQRALAYARASTIARQRNMSREQSIRTEALTLARETVRSEDTRAAALTLLAVLAVPAKDGSTSASERAEVRSLLVGLASTLTHIDETVRLLRLVADDDGDKIAALRLHIERYIAEARSDPLGARKMHFAYRAMQLAEQYEQFDLRDEAAVVLQSSGKDIKLASFRTEVRRSRNHLRGMLGRYKRARNWGSAYAVFLAGDSPTGQHARNLAEARSTGRGLLSLISNVALGPHNLPTRTGADPVDERLRKVERVLLVKSATELGVELDYIRDRFAIPTREEFAAWMSTTFGTDDELNTLLADAQVRHWEGDYSGASRVSIPLIEAAARALLLALDEPVYRAERGARQAQFPTMDFYVQSLEDNGLDIDWVRAIRATLLSDGLNLRNLYAHGFKLQFGENESALLLRIAGLLCALPGTLDRTELATPTTPPRRGLRRRLGWVWR